jgi:hypothetical protein
MTKVKAEIQFENVKEWYEAETRVYTSHSCIPCSAKIGDGKKVIVLVLGEKNGKK